MLGKSAWRGELGHGGTRADMYALAPRLHFSNLLDRSSQGMHHLTRWLMQAVQDYHNDSNIHCKFNKTKPNKVKLYQYQVWWCSYWAMHRSQGWPALWWERHSILFKMQKGGKRAANIRMALQLLMRRGVLSRRIDSQTIFEDDTIFRWLRQCGIPRSWHPLIIRLVKSR